MYIKKYAIYTLEDPESGAVHYVGLTSDVRDRYNSHCNSFSSQTPVSLWIKGLIDRGLQPIMGILEEDIPSYDAWERERYWIHFFLAEEEPLLNRTIPAKPKPIIRRQYAQVTS